MTRLKLLVLPLGQGVLLWCWARKFVLQVIDIMRFMIFFWKNMTFS
ncbi:hypothetical protein R2601_15772 [Salipiger bermudensis HTCC2601]|uniref:Uncharacterized protein n=1 Tax=Salipiger bermudensis (strain DSM 26914 / JCM 13377 / KCTC 12554 / HTCC2601) TaxID=314265 RepID=Q0FQE7_SALBH|nr:hypothetical protein R2601_15772 [Salipiger bermudensis HTCC2601]